MKGQERVKVARRYRPPSTREHLHARTEVVSRSWMARHRRQCCQMRRDWVRRRREVGGAWNRPEKANIMHVTTTTTKGTQQGHYNDGTSELQCHGS